MSDLLTFIFEHPNLAVSVTAVFVCLILGRALLKSFKEKLDEAVDASSHYTNRMHAMKESLEHKMQLTNMALNAHREDMGKATKAINGDMLTMKEKVFELKQDLIMEIVKIQSLSKDTANSLELARETSKLAIESLNQKLGRVILIEKSLETYGAQITKLQTGVGELRSDAIKNQEWFSSISLALKSHKNQLEAINRQTKKDSKNGI